MIEIVFSDSACGSLKSAQSSIKDGYTKDIFGVIMSEYNSGALSCKELSHSIPFSGNAEDVFGFNLMLSVGDISNDDFLKKRANLIKNLWSVYPNFLESDALNLLKSIQTDLNTLRNRITSDDEVRIWYSDHPDEICGLYWFISELATFQNQPKAVHIVKLPNYKYTENNTMLFLSSWGEISPSSWSSYTGFTKKTNELFRKYCTSVWKNLQHENMPLRAVLNGKIHSVCDDIYDTFILREIAKQEDEFSQAMLIGIILGKYQLGLSDSWLSNRIEKFITSGFLKVVSKPYPDMPIYHRQIRKTNQLP